MPFVICNLTVLVVEVSVRYTAAGADVPDVINVENAGDAAPDLVSRLLLSLTMIVPLNVAIEPPFKKTRLDDEISAAIMDTPNVPVSMWIDGPAAP